MLLMTGSNIYAYEVSMSPSRSVQTVCSTTVCTPVFAFLSTLYRRMLSLP
jgi:hypothetical protein